MAAEKNVIHLQKLQQDRRLQALLEKGNTIPKRYEGDIRRFLHFAAETGQNEGLETLIQYLAYSLDVQKVKKSTFERRLAAVKKYFSVTYGQTFTDQQQEQLSRLRKLYTLEEYSEQIHVQGQAAADKGEVMAMIDKMDKREKAIALVNLITANRPSEMVRLKVSDFDLVGRSVRVYLPKQKQWHNKRLTQEVVKAVKAYVKAYKLLPDDYFVTRERHDERYKGKPLGETAYNRLIHKILGFAPYTLRKTQVTAMHEAGADLPTIAKQTGHKSLETISKHYLNVNDKTVDKYL